MTLVNLNQYGMPFQIKVLSSLLTHKEFLLNIHDILSDEYFDNQAHKWIIKEVMKYYEKYHTTPSMDVLKVELQRVTNDVLKVSIKEQLKSAYESSEEDLEYVQEEFASFCKNQQLKKALLTSVDFLNAGDYDSIRSMINNAIKAGEDRNIGHEYEKDIESRYREDARNVIPFPWKSFNNVTQGGYGSGDLVLIFGNPKGGKSWATIAMAAEAVKLGFNIVYYALELGENYVGKRFDACLTGIPVDEVINNRNKVEGIVSQLPGKLVIKEYPPKRATLSTIESHLEKLDFKPDAIFIDYLDLLSNRKTRSERKDDIDDVYTDAKGLAKELGIPIISPSQANRTGADEDILQAKNAAGSYDKIMIGDIIISLARGRKDKVNGTGNWHFIKNRYGADGLTFSSKINTANGYININEQPMSDNFEDKSKNNKTTSFSDVGADDKYVLRNKFLKYEEEA